MDKQLRLLAGEIIVESEMTTSAKLQLLNFIKEEATDAQVKALLMDGKIVKLDEQAEDVVNDRFDQHYLNETGTFLQVLASMTGVLKPWRKLAATFSDAHRQCGIQKIAKDRDACLASARLSYAKKKVESLKKIAGQCNRSNNPAKCKATMKQQVEKEQKEVKKQESKIYNLSKKGRGAGHDPSTMIATRD